MKSRCYSSVLHNRCVSESSSPTKGTQVESPKVSEADRGPPLTRNSQSSPQPQPRSSVGDPQSVPSSALAQPKHSDAASASPATARRGLKTTQAAVIQAHRRRSSEPEGTRGTHAVSQVQSSGKPAAKPVEVSMTVPSFPILDLIYQQTGPCFWGGG